MLAGRMWFKLSGMRIEYRVEYVLSVKKNLADGPSRGDLALMFQLDAHEVQGWVWPSFVGGLDGWMCERIDTQKAVARC